MKTAEVARLFDELKSELVPLIATLAEHADRVDGSWLHDRVPVEPPARGRDRGRRADGLRSGRLADRRPRFTRSRRRSAQRTSGSRRGGTRTTFRWRCTARCTNAATACTKPGSLESLQRTPLGHAESLGLHESQSRMWENMVGRGRPFSQVLAPLLARSFAGSFAELEPDTLYRAVNRVQPSYIRVEADEATYGLHIVLRFELEQELIEGRLKVSELPEAWNARFKAYLGLDVTDDAEGVLQDVHWSMGAIGYFPTYALGNLIGGQLWDRAHLDIPDLDEQLARGRAPGAARMAARARPPARREVLDARAAAARRRRTDRGGAVRALPEGQARRRLRPRAVARAATALRAPR